MAKNISANLIHEEPFNDFGADFDVVACFDENGSAGNLKLFQKIVEAQQTAVDDNMRYFTLTCCIFKKSQYFLAKQKIQEFKNLIWPNYPKQIVLHTREINKSEGPFHFDDAKRQFFIDELSKLIDSIKCKIISVTFDLYSYVLDNKKYDPYEVAFDIILETMMFDLKPHNKVALVFEARGNKENHLLSTHIEKIINKTGTKRFKKQALQEKFRGIFFNHKISEDGTTVYHGIEIADLCSYPIYRFMRYGTIKLDFDIVVKKLAGYHAYKKDTLKFAGLRKFPSAWKK